MPTSSEAPGSLTATRIWKRFRDDFRMPFLQDFLQAATNRARRKQTSEWRWALTDVDFHIEPGEAVGLIGANGAGKSTLLKILTRVMYPHTGRVDVYGRVGALIEVRAGIHPDLTGRENIYLYGSLLGLPRKQVQQSFDAIVDFAQLEVAIDRQVKFYSTGMQMRLGFAVAAFLEPDVLVVDEVLAVGDANFQQRCLDRMRQVLAAGTTLVLVSHDLASIEAMCDRGMWLEKGLLREDGPIREVLGSYRREIETVAERSFGSEYPTRILELAAARPDGSGPVTHDALAVQLTIESQDAQPGWVYLGVSEGAATPVFLSVAQVPLVAGQIKVEAVFRDLPLPRGRYYLWICIMDAENRDLLPWHPGGFVDVAGPELDPAPTAIVRLSPVQVACDWSVDGAAL